MNIDGRDFLTCAEKKCDVKYCDHRIGCNCDELGCIVWIPGLDCPKAAEKAVKEAMEEQKAEMKFIKIPGAYINPEAVDMIYIDHDSGYSWPETNILLRSGQIIVVQARMEEVKKAVTEATDLLPD